MAQEFFFERSAFGLVNIFAKILVLATFPTTIIVVLALK